MRALKCQCSIFKENYIAFSKGDTDKETMQWMKLHREECTPCREWCQALEAGHQKESSEESAAGLQEKTVEKKMMPLENPMFLMAVGIGIVIFAALCMSIWMPT